MATLNLVKQQLLDLEKRTHSEVFAMSRRIVEHLEARTRENRITIGGLRAALQTPRSDDGVLIEAAFMLTIHPFEVLDVQYRFYDSTGEEIIEVLDKYTYADALNSDPVIVDGEEIDADDFHSRTYPLFLNLLADNTSSTDQGVTQAYE